MVVISLRATVSCSVAHMSITCDELFFVNTKAGLDLSFNVFEQYNEDCVINSLSFTNKYEFLLLFLATNKLNLCFLLRPVKILCAILSI